MTWVHLGCSTQEKHHAQPVKINIKLFLSTPLLATDNINDTVCYVEIVRLVQKLSQENHFNLIEYLATQIYDIIYQNFIESKLEKIFLNVTVTKLKLLKSCDFRLLKQSIIFETQAILPPNANKAWDKSYLNMVVQGKSTLTPSKLLIELKKIENN
ncbi:dihydroneopterin aldolase [Rickettsia amblyommatis]|uniref:dihydroneopterin aldolase n=1 Tax=Rickettsia amblyommatis TaxID=33989 RepID=UPI001E466297|nr:dihydroneopterin aldolase [Rickettsia amblyommatis]